MDAFEILGIRANPKTQSDLIRLHKRAQKLVDYYWKKHKREDAKRVKWAFEKVKTNSGLEMPKDPEAEAASAVPDAGGASPASPASGGDGDRGLKRKASNQLNDAEKRREAIREKVMLRRKASEVDADDKSKRQEQIKERLAAKRVMKKVPVRSEEEGKKAVIALMAATATDANGEEGGDRKGHFPLLCPISIERIKTAARGNKCAHLQCFDLESFLASKATTCPICEAAISPPGDLISDAFLTLTVGSVADDTVNEIRFDDEGDWTVVAGASSGDDSDDDVGLDGSGGNDMMFAATPWSPGPGSPEPEEDEDAKWEAEEAARVAAEAEAARKKEEDARRAALVAQIVAERAAKKAEEERIAAEKAEEERKMKALLPFIPKGRAAKPKVLEAAPAAASSSTSGALETAPGLDAQNENSYVTVELTKPLGIVFEANGLPHPGVHIRSFNEDGAAAQHGRLRTNYQLVGVDGASVVGQDLDKCIETILGTSSQLIKVTFYRGEAEHLYGKAKPAAEWLQGMLDRVKEGTILPSPPLEKRDTTTGKPRVKIGLDDGEEDDDDAEL
mmetsp:Transcript_96633/g.211282  ORF Transcript_96633/g.211282 Transcript_96633/m.211282 type:complete len:562 (-) Transcript_96633:107-1792(-)